MTGAGGVEAAIRSAISWLAAAVPSAPQTGQAMADGIRPFTGSTSKANLCPQPHWSLMGMGMGMTQIMNQPKTPHGHPVAVRMLTERPSTARPGSER